MNIDPAMIATLISTSFATQDLTAQSGYGSTERTPQKGVGKRRKDRKQKRQARKKQRR